MSGQPLDLIPKDVTTVAEIAEPQASAPKVVDNVNDHTPEPTQPPGVTHVPDPPAAQDGGLEAVQDAISKLGTALDALTAMVLGQQKDESPHSVPWTHRGGSTPTRNDDSGPL